LYQNASASFVPALNILQIVFYTETSRPYLEEDFKFLTRMENAEGFDSSPLYQGKHIGNGSSCDPEPPEVATISAIRKKERNVSHAPGDKKTPRKSNKILKKRKK
jgi:hypothetical protein